MRGLLSFHYMRGHLFFHYMTDPPIHAQKSDPAALAGRLVRPVSGRVITGLLMPDKLPSPSVFQLSEREAIASLIGRILARHWLNFRSTIGANTPGTGALPLPLVPRAPPRPLK